MPPSPSPDATTHEPRARVLLAFAVVYVVWGSTYLAIRFGVETLPPFLMGGVRFLLAGGALFAWARLRGAPALTRTEWRPAAIAGVLLLFGGNGALVWAEQRVASGIAALLVATVPVWMVLLDWLRPGGTRPRAGVFAGLALGLAGLALLVGPGAFVGHSDAGGVDPLGAGILVLGSVSWAAGSIYLRQAPRARSAQLSNAVQMLAGGAALLVAGLLGGEVSRFHPAEASTRSLLSLLYLAVFGSLIAFTAYTYILRVSTAAKVATYAYVNPVVAVLLGWAFAGEPITVRTLAAAAVILLGVAIITVAGSGGARGAATRAPVRAAEAERATARRRRASARR